MATANLNGLMETSMRVNSKITTLKDTEPIIGPMAVPMKEVG